MSEWNFMSVESKGNLLDAVRRESDWMLEAASASEAWEAPTAAGHWQVRDVIGHLVDTTEGYFSSFDAAAQGAAGPEPLGVRGMDKHVDDGARAYRDTAQVELLARLEADRARMLKIFDGLDGDGWAGLVPHKYMGPLPAFFYPAFQLVDYVVHGWDIREGTGRAHAMDGDSADLLAPLCFVLWQATADCGSVEPFSIGVRVSGRNAGTSRIDVTSDGMQVAPGDVDDLPLVLEFDPASLVLTAFGRINGGTARGDADLAARFCNLFFRI
jgi:uncharacterized protein (TIGR03083 family)